MVTRLSSLQEYWVRFSQSHLKRKVKMNENLTLSIKQVFFDEILAGKKTSEFREVTPTTLKRYVNCVYNEDDKDENSFLFYDLIPYKTITFYTGQFKGKRKGIKIECLGANVEHDEDDKGKNIFINDENGQPICPSAVIEYKLGEIIENINF